MEKQNLLSVLRTPSFPSSRVLRRCISFSLSFSPAQATFHHLTKVSVDVSLLHFPRNVSHLVATNPGPLQLALVNLSSILLSKAKMLNEKGGP